jgi:hypothetical protein
MESNLPSRHSVALPKDWSKHIKPGLLYAVRCSTALLRLRTHILNPAGQYVGVATESHLVNYITYLLIY